MHVFPDDWKFAKVKPLHKGDPKDILNNYRQISLLSAVSKIFERIVYDQLQTYLNESGLIYDKQSGFIGQVTPPQARFWTRLQNG